MANQRRQGRQNRLQQRQASRAEPHFPRLLVNSLCQGSWQEKVTISLTEGSYAAMLLSVGKLLARDRFEAAAPASVPAAAGSVY